MPHNFQAMTLFRWITLCIILSGVVIFIGGLWHPVDARSRELVTAAKEFKVDLLAAISEAHRIDVVEHSWYYEFLDEKGELVENPPYVEYKRTELTPDQRTHFQAAFRRMPENPKTIFSLCIFEPHHTIELLGKDGSKSVIQVCFKCGDTEWDGRSVIPPEGFQDIFRSFITPLGFQANREWKEIAKDKAQQAVPLNDP